MKPLTAEWVDKAEGDFATAGRELLVGSAPNYDAACFHAQQCAEKYLKARLVEAGVSVSRTHDLVVILDSLLGIEPSWESLRQYAEPLTDLAVEVRYPGTCAEKDDALEAVECAARVRHNVRQALGLLV